MRKLSEETKKKLYCCAIPLGIVLVLLCIPYTNGLLLGVFGYMIYPYFAASLALSVLYCIDMKINLSKKRIALIVACILCAAATIHIGVIGNTATLASFPRYLVDPFVIKTVGGSLLSLLTCILVVPMRYTAVLVLFFVLTAVLLFACVAPMLIYKKGEEKKPLLVRKVKKTIVTTELPSQPVLEQEIEEKPASPQGQFFSADRRTFDFPPSTNDLSEEDKLYTDNERAKPRSMADILFEKPKKKNEPQPEPKKDLGYTPYKQETTSSNKTYNLNGIFFPDGVNDLSDNLYDESKKNTQQGTQNYADTSTQRPFSLFNAPKEVPPTRPNGNYLTAETLFQQYKPKEQPPVEQTAPSGVSVTPFTPSRTDDEEIEKSVASSIEQEETPVTDPTEAAKRLFEKAPERPTTAYSTDDEEIIDDDDEEILCDDVFSSNNPVPETEPAPMPEPESEKPVERKNRLDSLFPTEPPKPAKPAPEPEPESETILIPAKPKAPYIAPHIGFLRDHSVRDFSYKLTQEEFFRNKETIESTMQSFGLSAEVVGATKGPTTTRYEVRLLSGSVTKVLKIMLDLTMRLSSKGAVDIIAPIEGKDAIGIDIPNEMRDVVSFRDIVACDQFQNGKGGLKIALGREIDGKECVVDLEKMPHLLVAGSTGSGKSVCSNVILLSLLYQHSPDELKLLLVDPKLVELVHYSNIPHMLVPEPLADVPTIIRALRWLEKETLNRFDLFRSIRTVSITAYNNYAKENGLEQKPRIVVLIDEATQLMTKAKKETEDLLSSIARIGRAAGVHLIFATQTPTREVLTSEIQNNLNTKFAFAVNDYVHSLVVLKAKGAERLLGNGDMLMRGDGGKLVRVQCAFVDTEEKEKILDFIRANNEADFDPAIYDAVYKTKEVVEERDFEPQEGGATLVLPTEKAPSPDEIKTALIIGFKNSGISVSLLQRKMGKGFNAASRIVDYLTEQGLIAEGEQNTNRKRKILITIDEFLEKFPDQSETFETYGIKNNGDEL